jgi:methyl-accepting chemotaxis protein
VKNTGKSKIVGRLVVGFAIVLVSLVGTVSLAINEISTVNANLREVNEINSVKQRFAINFRGSVHDRAISLRDVVLVSKPAELEAALAEIKQLEEFYAKAAIPMDAMFAGSDPGAADLRLLTDIKAVEARTMPLVARVIEARQKGDGTTAHSILLNEARPAFVDWLKAINRFIDFQEARNKTIGAEVEAIVSRFALLMIVIGTIAVIVGAGFAYWNVRSLRPLRSLTSVMLRLAQGDIRVEVPSIGQKDEVGEMAAAVEVFKQNTIAMQNLEREQETQKAVTEAEKRATMSRLADEFESRVLGIVHVVSAAATQLQQNASRMSSVAEESSHKSNEVAVVSESAASNVGTVASAAEELSASIQEIASRVESAARIADQASSQATLTANVASGLASSAQRIGEVVSLINDIAAQTNLLALNATIEAARAGEAGKGFAVVASEVKTLASQTAKATDDISKQIQEVQSATSEVVGAINSITATIEEINSISSAIALSVDQQGAATSEIARSITQAAHGTDTVKANVEGFRYAASETRSASDEIVRAANDLSHQSEALHRQVSDFIQRVRAA